MFLGGGKRLVGRSQAGTEQGTLGRFRWRWIMLAASYLPILGGAVVFWGQQSVNYNATRLHTGQPGRIVTEGNQLRAYYQRARVLVEDDSVALGLGSYDAEEGGPNGPCHKMLWVTGIAGKTAADRVVYLQAALLSAREHAPSLVPVLVYSGEPDEITRWFTEHGGHVVHHTLSFLPEFEAQKNETWREQLVRVQGIYLRLDIHEVMLKVLRAGRVDMGNVSARYALYTDVDVMFAGGGDISTCTQPRPRLLSLGPENVRGRAKNTGVMLVDVAAWFDEWPKMLKYGVERDFNFTIAMDQGWVLAYFNDTQQEIELLDDRYNWKGYFGPDDGVRIFHWHGPKPNRCLPCFIQHRGRSFWPVCRHRPGRYPIGCSKNHMQLLRASSDPEGNYYVEMVQRFKAYVAAAGKIPGMEEEMQPRGWPGLTDQLAAQMAVRRAGGPPEELPEGQQQEGAEVAAEEQTPAIGEQ